LSNPWLDVSTHRDGCCYGSLASYLVVVNFLFSFPVNWI
jgi:hypothetical protein